MEGQTGPTGPTGPTGATASTAATGPSGPYVEIVAVEEYQPGILAVRGDVDGVPYEIRVNEEEMKAAGSRGQQRKWLARRLRATAYVPPKRTITAVLGREDGI